MRDADVRSAIRGHLAAVHRNDRDTLVVEEMGIWNGAVRIDVAVINGEMHGFELKSERDTLERLPTQRALYDLVFDRITLVCAGRHAEKALSLIPDWWGVTVAVSTSNNTVALEEMRPSQHNPSIDLVQVARLLWRDEMLEVLDRHGGTKGLKSAAISRLVGSLAERLEPDELRTEVRAKLKSREAWSGKLMRHD